MAVAQRSDKGNCVTFTSHAVSCECNMHMRKVNVFDNITLVGFRIGVLGSAIAACATQGGPPARPEPGVIDLW